MKHVKRTGFFFALMLMLVLCVLGCSNDPDEASPSPTNADKPEETAMPTQELPPADVTLTFFSTSASLNKDNFQTNVAEPVKKQFPQITVELIEENNNQALFQRVISGDLPDIIQAAPGGLSMLLENQVMADLYPYINKFDFDLNRLKPEVVEGVKVFDKAQFLFMPVVVVPGVMYYNKTLFDKFGTPYPADGLTWPETFDVARKLTVLENDVQYRGLGVPIAYQISNNQLSLTTEDGETGKATIDTDGWKKWFNMLTQVHQIEGNQATAKEELNTISNVFSKEQTLAMLAWASNTYSGFANAPGLDWDMATMPSFPDQPNTNIQLNANFLTMTTTSKYKDEAFRVISVLLSDDIQKQAAEEGQLSVLHKAEINEAFGVKVPALEGKNVAAIYRPRLAPPAVRTALDGPLRNIVIDAYWEVVSGQADINTALRDAQEKAQVLIDSK